LAKVTHDDVGTEMLEIVATAGRANEKAEVGARGCQRFRDVAADESGGACYKRSQFSVLRSQ
jgi:hypothetical protein